MRTWIDENTGREVRQLTACPEGARVPYFRLHRHFPDGRLLVHGKHETGSLAALDVESGDVQFIRDEGLRLLNWRESDGCAWFYNNQTREVFEQTLPAGESRAIGTLPTDVEGDLHEITCDGRTLLGAKCECEPSDIEGLFGGDHRAFWRWIYRRRNAVVWAYDLLDSRYSEVLQMPGYNPQHIDASPADPHLFKYAQDGLAVFDQRAHAVHVDGTAWRQIRPQAPGEWVHHEFWWPDAQFIGYKYMDRRDDPTIHLRPWGEYAPRPLRLGIANLAGEEVYLSDPLDHYQSHLNVSPDARFVTGEGTHNHSFASVALFDQGCTRIAFVAVGTTHTPYVPAKAQGVETCVTKNSRWVVYNDTVDGQIQVCAVKLEL